MKKSTKRLLIAVLCFAIVGMAFCIAGLGMGFRFSQLRTMAENGDLHVIGPANFKRNFEEAEGLIASEDIEFEETYKNPESLHLAAGVATCVLIPYDGKEWKVTGTHLPSEFHAEVTGKTLYVDFGNQKLRFWDSEVSHINIYIPKSQKLDQLKLDNGVGSVAMEEGFLTCRKLEVECGVGECTLQLNILDKADVQGGIGSFTLVTQGTNEAFDYDLECGIGEIVIDGETRSGFAGKVKIDNDASKEMKIDCGIGSVQVLFETETATHKTKF